MNSRILRFGDLAIGVLVLVVALAAPAAAQQPGDPDAEGCKDSALLTRFPGCTLVSCDARDFDELTLTVKSWDENDYQQTLEGKTEYREYTCPAKNSVLQIARNAEAALKKGGFTIVYSGKAVNDWPAVTARKGGQWVTVETKDNGGEPWYEFKAVLAGEAGDMMTADASAMAEAIEKTGSVAVYGINFDTGKATLTAGSEQVLQEVLSLMKGQPAWRFEVQGHTDNVGAGTANQALSEQRAAAVVGWLVKNGVDTARLTAKGYGDTQPVAENTNDEGRAKNRRVELKKIGN